MGVNGVLHGLAVNEALPSELVDRLIAGADAELGSALAGRVDLGRAQVVALAACGAEAALRLAHEGRLAAGDVDPVAQPEVALALLDRGTGQPDWARLLAGDPVVARREKLAACPGLPAEVVETLANDPDVRVVAELALWTTPEMTARLAAHPHAEVRRSVAANEATPPGVLAALITGGWPVARWCLVCDREETPFVHDPYCPRRDCDLRPGASCDGSHGSTVLEMWVAAVRNPATPLDAVVGFAAHPSALLRWELAARPGLPLDVCRRLAADPVAGVRGAVAENPSIDEVLARTLAADDGYDVRRRLAHNPRVPLGVLGELAGTTKIGTAVLPRIAAASAAEVEGLARSANPVLRMLLAERRDLPDAIRDLLAADRDAKVVGSIASHPGLSEAQLRAMVGRHGARVAAKVAANPDASSALLEELARRDPPVRKALREVAGHRNATGPALLACLADERARSVAAGHPALPAAVLVELLADEDERVVEAAAGNRSLPLGVMRELVP